eukprot:TRINITY_DN586_c0_g2_i1.p1 TRINITY_DN586_c0_g2~~TRINITY_DN586_c0_g2_i1.p1  ORF type:complete len:313 (-),score=61.79 TRINITY_DN586_c0_g2_i1:102-1040(-)
MSLEQIHQLLKSTPVEQISATSVIVVSSEDSLRRVFEILSVNNILSAPVYDLNAKKLLGVVELVDLLSFILKNLPASFLEKEKGGLYEESELNQNTLNLFLTTPIRDITLSSSPHKQVLAVEKTTSLWDVAKLFADGAKRIFVKHGHLLVSVVSESNLLQFVNSHASSFASISQKTVSSLQLIQPLPLVVSVEQKSFEVFTLLQQKDLNAAAVVDEDGKLLTNVSLRDIKGLRHQHFRFSFLHLPILELLEENRKHSDKARAPVFVVQPTDTYAHVLSRIQTLHVHQLYVKDEQGKPSGVVLSSSLIKLLLN